MHPLRSDEREVKYYPSLLKGEAFHKPFKNKNFPHLGKLEDVMEVLRWKFLRPLAVASRRNKWDKLVLVFDPPPPPSLKMYIISYTIHK